jgi:predicted nucleotidyltransferase
MKAGESLNAHGIARSLMVSQAAVSKALPTLERENILLVKKDKDTGRLSISLNKERHDIIWLKRADNLEQLYDSGLTQHLYDTFPSATIILFGSYAFGEDTANSDIDLAIVGAKQKDVALDAFSKALERPITLHCFDSFSSIDKHLLNNILNGIVLKGSVEL